MTTLRVAAAQAVATAGDVAANVDMAASLVRLAAGQGIRLLVLPEAFLTGYCRAAFAGEVPAADALDGVWIDPLRVASVEGDCVVVVSTPLQRAGVRTLSTLVVRPDATVTAPYDKQHLSGYEHDYFVAGDHGASITVDGLELGLSICYDGCFPEHARAAAEDGAVGYLNSAAYLPGGGHRRDVYYAARAVENGMYVVLAGLTGPCGDEELIGGSAIYDPEGRPIARLGTEPGLAIGEIDSGLVAETRKAHPMLLDHRGDLGPRTRA